MPAFAATLQKSFKLTIVDGLPQADVEKNGGVHWVKCCPLCGCMHQLLGVNEKLPYSPMCQTLPQLYKAQQVIWRGLYPEVAKYSTMHLIVSKET